MKVEERKAIPGRGHSTCKSNYLTTVPQAWEIICSNTMRTNICSWNELIYFDRLHLFSHQGYPENKRMFIGIAAWYRKVERNKGRRGKRIEKERERQSKQRGTEKSSLSFLNSSSLHQIMKKNVWHQH